MEIPGHKTANVFKRYNISDENDLAEVAAALDRKRQAEMSQLSHNSLSTEKQPQADHQQEPKIQ